MENLLFFLPFFGPVIVAQFGHRQRWRWPRYATYGLLVTINVALLAVVGLALLNQFAKMFMPSLLESQGMVANWWGVAVASLLTSIVAFLPLIPAVPRWLARWLPIDPESLVHVTALVFAIYQIGLNLGQLALIGNLENLAETDITLTMWDVLFTGVPLTLFALLGVGLMVRRDGHRTLERLGVQRPTWQQLLLALGITILLLALDLGVNVAWEKIDPEGYDLLDRVTQNIFGNLTTVSGALVLGLSAGISEELLFRGAVLPKLGLPVATLLFAMGHMQYGLTLATLEVFVIGLVLGLIRKRTNTTVCIVIHAAYDVTTMLLGSLQP